MITSIKLVPQIQIFIEIKKIQKEASNQKDFKTDPPKVGIMIQNIFLSSFEVLTI